MVYNFGNAWKKEPKMKRERLYKIFTNMPVLKTERLSLRLMHPIDAEDMFDYAKREDVTRYLTWKPHPSISYTRSEEHTSELQSLY